MPNFKAHAKLQGPCQIYRVAAYSLFTGSGLPPVDGWRPNAHSRVAAYRSFTGSGLLQVHGWRPIAHLRVAAYRSFTGSGLPLDEQVFCMNIHKELSFETLVC